MTDYSYNRNVSWSNTEGTYLDSTYSHKFLNYNGIEYIAQCLNYRGEIRPRGANYVYPELKKRIMKDWRHISEIADALKPIMFGPWSFSVPELKQDETNPFWQNGYFSYSDARAAYAMVARLKPRLILEVGSGHSTKFFRKAITETSQATKILSVDPAPRADIQGLIDEFITSSVLDIDITIFDRLSEGDILFWDGSHVCYSGSDVDVLFLDVLPRLKPGVIVHVHDVSLPYAGARVFGDLPDDLSTLCTSEDLILATFLLNAKSANVMLPIHYLHKLGVLHEPGHSFWFVNG